MASGARKRVGEAWARRRASLRTRPRPRRRPKPGVAPASAPAPGPGATSIELREMRAQRDRLIEKFTVMQADLGGAFYEMAIRDHVRLDVLTRKAAELQRVDAELMALEAALELERTDAAGICHGCGAPYRPGARFCGQCAARLTPSGVGA